MDKGNFLPENLNPSLCTHIIYAYAKVAETEGIWGLEPTEWNDLDMDWADGMYTRFHNVTNAHPGLKVRTVFLIFKEALNFQRFFAIDYCTINLKDDFELKTLLSVGGRNHDSADWTRMVSTNSSIDSFVNQSMSYIRENKFDGIDIDWQFPAFCENVDACSPVSDAARFKVLLEKFRAAIGSENVPSANKMIISSSAGHRKNQIYKTSTSTTTTSTSTPTDLNKLKSGLQYLDLFCLL